MARGAVLGALFGSLGNNTPGIGVAPDAAGVKAANVFGAALAAFMLVRDPARHAQVARPAGAVAGMRGALGPLPQGVDSPRRGALPAARAPRSAGPGLAVGHATPQTRVSSGSPAAGGPQGGRSRRN